MTTGGLHEDSGIIHPHPACYLHMVQIDVKIRPTDWHLTC